MYKIFRADNTKHKYGVVIPDGRTIYFGAKGYEDYTMHKDKQRKLKYLARHSKNENWHNPSTSGYWSRWLLWNKKSLVASAVDIRKKFGLVIKFIKTKPKREKSRKIVKIFKNKLF